MDWLLTHIWWWLITDIILLTCALVYWRTTGGWGPLVAWIFPTAFLMWLAYLAATKPPFDEPAVIQKKATDPSSKIPSMDVLAREWNPNEGLWEVATIMADCSAIAYSSPVRAKQKYEALGFQYEGTLAEVANLGHVISRGDVTVVAFRGTDDSVDWFTNLNRFPKEVKEGEFHGGFYDAYVPLGEQLREILKSRDRKIIWITGHSLGGALALICAFDLGVRQQRSIAGVITFGQPRTVHDPPKTLLSQTLRDRYVCFVNESDVVPRIPPSFLHCGTLVWFTEGKVLQKQVAIPVLLHRVAWRNRDSTEPDSEDWDELAPLSNDEFQQMQAYAKAYSQRQGYALLSQQAKEEPEFGDSNAFSRWLLRPFVSKQLSKQGKVFNPDEEQAIAEVQTLDSQASTGTKWKVMSLLTDHDIARYQEKIKARFKATEKLDRSKQK